MDSSRTYLDYAATTPVDPRVIDAMLPFFSDHFGNPSSVHTFGQASETALEGARRSIAGILNCQPKEIVFTSGGSESDNLALRGAALAARSLRGARTILISPVEHHAVSHTAEYLAAKFGFKLEHLDVDQFGLVDPDQVRRKINTDTAVVSVIYANNEIGSINPIPDLAAICREQGIVFHTDAVQAVSYLELDVEQLHIDLLSLGAHKFYGPKGIGALYIREGTPIETIITGGGQESGYRAGTQNVPLIVGMSEALQLVRADSTDHVVSLRSMRNQIIAHVLEHVEASRLTGHPTRRLPNHVSFVFDHIDGNALLAHLDLAGFACSSGSACKTGSPSPSDVLLAIGVPPSWALGSLRVTLGRPTQPEEIDAFLSILPIEIANIRRLGVLPAG